MIPNILSIEILRWWSAYYGNHQAVSVTVRFIHLVALLLGGGTALFVDRRIIRARRLGETGRMEALRELHKAHRLVVPWIAVLAITGVFMTAADTDTFLVSRVYWIKMAVVALLAGNGIVLLVTERRAMRSGMAGSWPRIVTSSTVSFILWIGALLLGTLLTVAA